MKCDKSAIGDDLYCHGIESLSDMTMKYHFFTLRPILNLIIFAFFSLVRLHPFCMTTYMPFKCFSKNQ